MIFADKLILAPLAGVGETVFRRLCKEQGADILVSEMVSAEGLLHRSENTAELLYFTDFERPFGVQLFGSDPQRLAAAAKEVYDRVRPDFIDLNSGCPVPKVVKKNGGAALLREPDTFRRIVGAMAAAVPVPVTVKIRCGWNMGDWVDVAYAKIAQQEGAAAITLHARTKSMGYSGIALWDRIALVKQAVTIPVIGNGDVVDPSSAIAMRMQTGCDAIMIGRAAMGNPWIFCQIKNALAGISGRPVTQEDRRATALRHLELFCNRYGERKTAAELKKHLAWYTHGLPGAAEFRSQINRTSTIAELCKLIDRVFCVSC